MPSFGATRQTSNAALPDYAEKRRLHDMKAEWLQDLWDNEAKYPVAFASARALLEARLIAEMERAKQNRRRRCHKVTAT